MTIKRWGWGFILIILSVVALTLRPTLSRAHPLGNFSINHYSHLRVKTDSINLQYILDMAEIPTFQTLQEHDLVADVSHPGMQAYLTQVADILKDGLVLKLNGQRLTLQVVDREMMFPPGAGELSTLKLGFVYRAELPQDFTAAAGQLRYQDTNFPDRSGWKEIFAAPGPGVTFAQSSVPTADRSRELTDYPTDLGQSRPQVLEAHVDFRFTGQPIPASQASVATTTTPQANQQAPSSHALTQLMNPGNLSLSMMLLAMSVAMGLGAFHALEPGHGKTVVAAYLVGSRGTARHALWLGVIVTVTHTAGVYLLGGITLYASQYIVPEQLYPWLGVISGVIITVLGVYLFLQRYAGKDDSHGHHPGEAHHHSHGLVSKPMRDHAQAVGVMGAIQQDQDIDYQVYRPVAHDHEHHDHHAHEHGHDHHLPGDHVTFRQLFMLGVTGGIVPCPAALVVLLSAVAMHRIGFGLLLIVAFSLGLAVVLIAIGLLMVYARQFMSRFQGDGSLMTRWLPLASAALITVFGIGMIVRVLMQNGILTIPL